MNSVIRVFFFLAALVGLAGPVSATTIVKHYDFTMNYHQGEFSKIWGGFDASYDANGGAIAVNDFWSNLPSAYKATAGSAYNNILTLGTNCDEHGCSVTSGQDEFSFVFVIDPTGDVIYPYSFVYARAQEYALFEGDRTDLKISPTAASITGVPEPASWAMMIAGVGLVGAVGRRRRTIAARATFAN